MNVTESVGKTTLIIRTRYLPFGGKPEAFPRELWVEAWVPANSLDEAIRRGQDRANTVVSVLSMAMNAATDPLAIEFAFDMCAKHQDHEFFENCILDESGLPRLARRLNADECLAFLGDILKHPARERLLRAIVQYEVALRYWLPGQETLALGHLYMAMEALTPVVRDIEIAKLGARSELLEAWHIEPKLCKHCSKELGIGDLDSEVRRRVLFQGDDEVYKKSKQASDALEHGFLGFDAIREHAVAHRDRLGYFVRHAVLDLTGVDATWRSVLMDVKRDEARPAARANKYLRCTLRGDVGSLASEAEQYPRFQLESSIKSIDVSSDGIVTVEPEEKLTPVLGENVIIDNLSFRDVGACFRKPP